MAKARKLPSGNWNCSVYSHTDENGKRHYVSFTASTKAEALRQGAEYMANKQRQDRPQDITVQQAIENYISSKSNVLSPNTKKEYKGYMKYYGSIKNIKIGLLSSVDIQRFVNDLAKDHSPKTVRNVTSLLTSSIKFYTDKNFHITLPQKTNIERHIPTDADIKKMLETTNKGLKLAILLGSQGVRRGEISALKYSDILRDFNAIYIHADMILGENGWEYKPFPKTDSSTRRLIIPKEIIDMMGEGEDDQYVLKIKPSTITSDFINLRNKLGLKCRFHDLRHYAASILHAIGVPDAYIMERGGWSSDTVLKSVYRNSLSDKSSHFTSMANDYFKKNVLGQDEEEEKKKNG